VSESTVCYFDKKASAKVNRPMMC